MASCFSVVFEAIAALQAGRMIILIDDEDRENEGDLVIAAEHINSQAINFMINFGRGLICLPMAPELIDKLQLPLMVKNNQSPFGTAFTVSIEAADGVSTGISSADRAHTIRVAVDPNSTAKDLISPGHIFPLRAREQGVLVRPGQTEGSIDLMKIAGLRPAAVICEIMNDDGTMSRREQLKTFSKQHKIPKLSISDIIQYRISNETLVHAVVQSTIPLQNHGNFMMTVFNSKLDVAEHFALMKISEQKDAIPLVRIHSECITGDVFSSARCDCGSQLEQSLAMIAVQGGIIIYLRQEGRGLGLVNKLRAYVLQDQGFDTVESNLQLGLPIDTRDYAIAYQILKYFNITKLRLLTNNPHKIDCLQKYGLQVSERIPLISPVTAENCAYLTAKKTKLGHLLDL